MTVSYFATVAPGLEAIAAQELTKLGASDVTPEKMGVRFSGDKALLYKVNLWARTIFRVLVPIKDVNAYNAQELYQNISKIDWREYIETEQTFAVNCTGSNPNLNHSHFTALQIKNAIVDQQRQQTGKRSSIDPEDPDIQINAHIYKTRCLISLDSSGGSLHRRGYRPAMGVAPLKETLASALLDLAEWDANLPFVDPLCGSGILALEAGLKALNIAPGLFRRHFNFQTWQDFDEDLWDEIVRDAQQQQIKELAAPIIASDADGDILQQAITNAKFCGLEYQIQFYQQELKDVEAPCDRGILICNPPYGKRIGSGEDLGALYKLLGDIFKQRFKGWTAYVLTGDKELAKMIHLKAARRFPINNGGLPCTFLKYEMY